MNTNKTTQHVKQLSEKAREGRRRRQRERRRRQRQQEQCKNEYDFDDDDDDDDKHYYDEHYYDIFDDYYRRSNFIVCDNKFNYLKKVDSSGVHTILAQIYSEHNSSAPSNLKTHAFNKTIKKLDEFIAQTPPTENIRDFQISGRDLYDGKKLYNTMKDDPEPNYEIFGSNSCGYTCFYLYKSNDKNMYIIVLS